MNLKLISTVISILTSILIIYFFFIIMRPNTNEKVVSTDLKNGEGDAETTDENEMDNDFDPDLNNDYANEINRQLLDNITPLSNNSDIFLPANALKLDNYKDLENNNSEKEVYTNDAPLFMTTDSKNKKAKPIDLNSQHRRVNFY